MSQSENIQGVCVIACIGLISAAFGYVAVMIMVGIITSVVLLNPDDWDDSDTDI